MNKIFILVISAITFISHIACMENVQNTESSKEKALICVSKSTNILLKQPKDKNKLNDKLLSCISKDFYVPTTMQELINKGASPDIALSHVWQKIKAPKIPDITNIPITKIMANTSQILDFNNNLKKQFTFLCEQQAFDQKTLTEIQSLKNMIQSITITLQQFDSLCPSTDNQKVIDETTIMKGLIVKSFLQSLANRLEKNQPLHTIEQNQS